MSQDENKISDQIDSGLSERDKLYSDIDHLTTEVTRLREAAKQRYLDGFTEGYKMAIEDIQEGNPLNKAANPKP
jgi:sensor c-di-GMP phosphodiesterase-like protein